MQKFLRQSSLVFNILAISYARRQAKPLDRAGEFIHAMHCIYYLREL